MTNETPRPRKELNFEMFSLRDNESVEIWESPPKFGRWFGAQLRSVKFPTPDFTPTSRGGSVEQVAVLACQINSSDGKWQWLQLSPETKEHIGDLLIDSELERDRWYFVLVTDLCVKK